MKAEFSALALYIIVWTNMFNELMHISFVVCIK